MWKKIVKISLLFILFNLNSIQAKSPHFVIFTGSYNNEKWVERFVFSLASQRYKNWQCIYVNDCSTDTTGTLIEELAIKYKIKKKMRIIHNQSRQKLVANMFTYLHQVDPKSIVVIVDGDDSLFDETVLDTLKKYYMDEAVWVTYGSCASVPANAHFVPTSKKLPKNILKKNIIRYQPWVTDHLRTFYAKLFQNIKKEDLQEESGIFFEVLGDVAIMFPIIEMSSKGHVRFIKNKLLLYNTENPLSDRYHPEEMHRVSQIIINRRRYKPIIGSLF